MILMTMVPASQPEAMDRVLLDHISEVRIRLAFTGVGDKPVLKLVVGVGASAKDLGEPEFENDDPQARRIAAICPVSDEEMVGIVRQLIRDGWLNDAHRWDAARHDISSQFLFSIEAAGRRAARRITGDGAAALRKLVRDHLRADNASARHALDLAGG